MQIITFSNESDIEQVERELKALEFAFVADEQMRHYVISGRFGKCVREVVLITLQHTTSDVCLLVNYNNPENPVSH
ncbi:hypothetical protein [Oleidesulfovibrio alaskensis]